MTRSFLEILDPQGFADQFDMVRKPDPVAIPDLPARPDQMDVIHMSNEGIEDVRDSALLAEVEGPFRPMNYRHDF